MVANRETMLPSPPLNVAIVIGSAIAPAPDVGADAICVGADRPSMTLPLGAPITPPEPGSGTVETPGIVPGADAAIACPVPPLSSSERLTLATCEAGRVVRLLQVTNCSLSSGRSANTASYISRALVI